jgi:protein O-mannosyl-transferase
MAVCLLALLVYSRSLLCGFVRDDIPQIVNNRQVQSWEYLPQLLGSHLWSQMTEDVNILFYRPIFSVWMLLMHTFGGLTPWFWHLSNVVLHLVATYLVFTLCRRLTRSDAGALAAAAIFALHPIHVDAVTWVSASCEILFTIFALAAMLALLPSRKESSPRVWVSALWFGAGLFAKETEIAMLPLLAVFAWVQIRERAQGGQRLWNAASPYGTVTAVYLLARWAVMHRVGLESGEHTWAEVVFSAPSIFLFYLKKLFLPSNLSGCYVNPLTASPNGTFWLQLTVCFVCLAAIAWFAFRYSRLLGPAFALIVIPVLPALAVIRIYPQGDMTHDRYLYLPSVGLALLVATLVQQASSLQKPAKIAVTVFVIAVAGVFSAETVLQQRYYQDDLTFYHRAIAVSPSDSFVRGMLGNVYLDQRRSDLAIEEFQKAHQISPENQKATLFLARGLFVVGKHHEAETVLKELLETRDLTPRRREAALLSLANVEIGLGNLDSAQQLLQQVDRSDDAFPELHWALGVVYQKQGLLPQALAEYEKEVDTTGDELARQRSAALAKLIYSQSAGRALKESGQR